MKTLIVQNTDWLRRNPAQQHHLAEMLSLRGYDIRVVDFEVNWRHAPHKELRSRRQVFKNVSKIHERSNVTVVRPGIIKLPFLDYISSVFSIRAEIKTQIRDFQPDIIIGIGISSLLAVQAARKNNLPSINYWIDISHRLLPYKFLQPLGWLIERQTVKFADRVLVINERLQDYVIRIGAKREQTFVLRAGINVDRFDPDIPRDVRNQLGLKKTDIVLFFMGWLYNFSGLKELAIQMAKIENKNLKLLIVGEGDAFDALQAIIRENSLQERVILAGQQPYRAIPNYVAAADICLLPSHTSEPIMRDIVPIKMYEYMAMKKPVICTELPGVMKEFGIGNGVVYVSRTDEVINKAIELWSEGKLDEIGIKAREFIERNTWGKMTDEFEMILKNAVKEKENGKRT